MISGSRIEHFPSNNASLRSDTLFGPIWTADDDYRIYEYNGSVFTEKRLVVTWSREVRYRITWQYYEEGELLKSLEQNYDEDAKMYYITYEENGIVTEEVMEEADSGNRHQQRKKRRYM